MFRRLLGPDQDGPAAGPLMAFSPPNSQAQNAFSFTGRMAFLSFSSSAHHLHAPAWHFSFPLQKQTSPLHQPAFPRFLPTKAHLNCVPVTWPPFLSFLIYVKWLNSPSFRSLMEDHKSAAAIYSPTWPFACNGSMNKRRAQRHASFFHACSRHAKQSLHPRATVGSSSTSRSPFSSATTSSHPTFAHASSPLSPSSWSSINALPSTLQATENFHHLGDQAGILKLQQWQQQRLVVSHLFACHLPSLQQEHLKTSNYLIPAYMNVQDGMLRAQKPAAFVFFRCQQSFTVLMHVNQAIPSLGGLVP